MTNAERQRRWRGKRRLAVPEKPRRPAAPTMRRLCVDKHDRILVDPPAKGERIYVDERGREIADADNRRARLHRRSRADCRGAPSHDD
jgi:hypothetical protein